MSAQKQLYMVAVVYRHHRNEANPTCFLTLRAGATEGECKEEAEREAARAIGHMPEDRGQWEWAGTTAEIIAREDVESLLGG